MKLQHIYYIPDFDLEDCLREFAQRPENVLIFQPAAPVQEAHDSLMDQAARLGLEVAPSEAHYREWADRNVPKGTEAEDVYLIGECW